MLIGRFYFCKVNAMNATPLRSTSKARPALRLISTKELPREGLRCLYPEDNGQTVDFSGHAGLVAAYLELKAVRQSIADKEKREAELKQMLQQAMCDASRAEFSSGYVSWRKTKDSIGLDVAQLLQDKPYLHPVQHYRCNQSQGRRSDCVHARESADPDH